MNNLNWVDYIFVAIFFFTILSGLSRGLVKEVISLITLVAAFVVASMFSHTLAATFTGSPAVQNMVSQVATSTGVNAAQPVSLVTIGICFGLLFAGTVVVGSIISSILNIAFQAGMLGVGNRLLGGAFGFGKAFLITLVIIFVVQLTPFGSQPSWRESQFVAQSQPAVQWLGNIVSPSIAGLKDKMGQTLQNVNSTFQGVTSGFSR